MTRIFLTSALALLVSQIGSPAMARDPIVFEPASKWNIDYADDKCVLKRSFSNGEDSLNFRIEQTSLEPFYNIILSGEPVKKARGELIRVIFGPDEEPTERSFLSGKLGPQKLPFLLMHGVHLAPAPKDAEIGKFVVVDIGAEREQAVTELTLEQAFIKPLKLEVGPMKEPLDAMRTCVADLVEALKLDAKGLAEVVKGPKPKNARQISMHLSDRYPERMLLESESGSVVVRLTVNPQGKATVCQIAASDRPAVFDDLACFGMLRIAEFEPAVGPDGEPRFGTFQTSVTFKIDD